MHVKRRAYEPTGPAPPEMKIVSPFLADANSFQPIQAVCPGIPARPTYRDNGSLSLFSITRKSEISSMTAYSAKAIQEPEYAYQAVTKPNSRKMP
jgi:hypothetical protein